ncbi:MAG: hypothetical protein B7Z23_05975, partial [Pseudomonadales bacterium 32-61-5]
RDALLLSLVLFGLQRQAGEEQEHCDQQILPPIAYKPVLFMRALKVTHFRQLDDPLTVFGLEGTIFGSVFTLSA